MKKLLTGLLLAATLAIPLRILPVEATITPAQQQQLILSLLAQIAVLQRQLSALHTSLSTPIVKNPNQEKIESLVREYNKREKQICDDAFRLHDPYHDNLTDDLNSLYNSYGSRISALNGDPKSLLRRCDQQDA